MYLLLVIQMNDYFEDLPVLSSLSMPCPAVDILHTTFFLSEYSTKQFLYL